ncbi:TPA: hypothetical protein ACI4HY_004043 [Providencia stuartii]
MSDKKEIATMHIKISVDSTDLDKLEGQLKRIEGLMVSTGLKQQAKQGFTADIGVFNPKGCLEPVFTVSPGVVYINEACIEKFKRQVESELDQSKASIAAIQRAMADSEQAIATSIEHIRADIQSVKFGGL